MESKSRKSVIHRVLSSWITILIVIPVAICWLSSPYISKWVWGSEVGAWGYSIVAKEYPTLSSDAQSVIARLFQKGYLTGPDMEIIYSAMLKERESIQTSPAPDFGDDPERLDSQVWRMFTGEPTKSKAKDQLVKYTANAAPGGL